MAAPHPSIQHLLAGLSDFAQTFTESALKAGTPEKIGGLIRKIDLIADRDLAQSFRIVDSPGSPFRGRTVACQAGCDYCCRQTVMATIPEVLAMATWLESNLPAKNLAALKKRAKDYFDEHEKLPDLGLETSRAACPALVDGQCVAYEARPLVCRSFHSYDVEACKRLYAGDSTAVRFNAEMLPAPVFMVDALRQGICLAMQRSNKTKGFTVMLGMALSIALHTENAAERWLAGEDVFAAANMRDGRDERFKSLGHGGA